MSDGLRHKVIALGSGKKSRTRFSTERPRKALQAYNSSRQTESAAFHEMLDRGQSTNAQLLPRFALVGGYQMTLRFPARERS
jgi:hypothetical protein